MSLDMDHSVALDDKTFRPAYWRKVRLQNRTLTMPTAFERAPVSQELGVTILNVLGRDDRLRWAYVRRRWQGLAD
jgi:hypothetical protein